MSLVLAVTFEFRICDSLISLSTRAREMEQKKLGVLADDAGLIAQMNEQRFEYIQPKSAREHIHLKFGHPPRRHDDQLFASVLACYASREEEPTLLVIPR